jgi:hypothetical protein
MNETLLKQFSILGAFFGAVLGVLTLIPLIGKLAFFVLLCLTSVIVIVIMTRMGYLEQLPVRDSVAAGAVIGFVSFIAFCVVFLPLFALLSKLSFYTLYGGVAMVLRAGTFGIMTMFVLFMGVFSATINAFSAFLTFYVMDFIKKL